MATTTTTATVELIRADKPLGVAERAAIAGFLAGYTGNTLVSYTTDLRLFVEWCTNHDLPLLERAPPEGRCRVTHARVGPKKLGALLVQAGLGSARDHALISLLALNGLRISEALGADVESMDMDRGHRTLAIVRKGGKHVIIPLAPRTARTIDLYLGERAGRSSSVRTASGWTATPLTAR